MAGRLCAASTKSFRCLSAYGWLFLLCARRPAARRFQDHGAENHFAMRNLPGMMIARSRAKRTTLVESSEAAKGLEQETATSNFSAAQTFRLTSLVNLSRTNI
jgi:hypothetical protein